MVSKKKQDKNPILIITKQVEIETPNFVKGDLAQYIIERIEKRISKEYGNNPSLSISNYDRKSLMLTGANSFRDILIHEELKKIDSRLGIATLADLERILESGNFAFEGTYENPALVLRTADDSYGKNNYLAKNLAKQIGIVIKNPLMINLTELRLKNDDKSSYGLCPKLRKDAKIIEAPQLAYENNGKNFSKTANNGLPIFDEKGNRTLYTRQDGLSRLDLDGSLNVLSGWDNLDDSDSGGRVVVVSDAVAQKSKRRN